MSIDQTQTTPTTVDGPIVARGGRYYRNTRFLITAMFLLFGGLCIKDGFYTYPKLNAQARAEGVKEPYPGWDVPLNRGLGILLPPLAVLLCLRALYNSRGEYRLEDDTLHAPGHLPIPLDAIRKIDKRLWERKGIAYIEYETPAGKRSRFKLDDFVYDAKPIRAIFERIEQHVKVMASESEPTPAAAG